MAGGVGQGPQAALRRPRAAPHRLRIGERLQPVLVRAAAALGPADEGRRSRIGTGVTRQPAQVVDGVVPLGVHLHEGHPQRRCRGRERGMPPDRHTSVRRIGGAHDQCRVPGHGHAPAGHPQQRRGQRHERTAVREEHERRALRTQQVRRLHEQRPCQVHVAEPPGKHGRHDGLGHHGHERRREPRGPRVAARAAHPPKRQRHPAGIPEHDRRGECQPDPDFRPHARSQCFRRPLRRTGDDHERRCEHGQFAAPAAPTRGQEQPRRHAQPRAGHQFLREPGCCQKRGNAGGGHDGREPRCDATPQRRPPDAGGFAGRDWHH